MHPFRSSNSLPKRSNLNYLRASWAPPLNPKSLWMNYLRPWLHPHLAVWPLRPHSLSWLRIPMGLILCGLPFRSRGNLWLVSDFWCGIRHQHWAYGREEKLKKPLDHHLMTSTRSQGRWTILSRLHSRPHDCKVESLKPSLIHDILHRSESHFSPSDAQSQSPDVKTTIKDFPYLTCLAFINSL